MVARSARPSLREEQRELTRQRVIASALAVFRETGFLATSLEDVAKHAGLNRGTIYLHFDSKGQILLAALTRSEADLDGLYTELTGLERRSDVAAFFGRVLEWWESEFGALLSLARDAAVADAEIAAWLVTTRRRHIKRIAARLEARGVARVPALARAEVFNAMLAQIASDRSSGELKSSSSALRDALADAFSAMFEPALRA